VLRYDANHKLIVPQEHSDIVMGHGEQGRNNNCSTATMKPTWSSCSPATGGS